MKQAAISARIKHLLKLRNMSQAELSKRLLSDESAVSRWANGKGNLTLKTIERIEEVLQSDIITVL